MVAKKPSLASARSSRLQLRGREKDRSKAAKPSSTGSSGQQTTSKRPSTRTSSREETSPAAKRRIVQVKHTDAPPVKKRVPSRQAAAIRPSRHVIRSSKASQRITSKPAPKPQSPKAKSQNGKTVARTGTPTKTQRQDISRHKAASASPPLKRPSRVISKPARYIEDEPKAQHLTKRAPGNTSPSKSSPPQRKSLQVQAEKPVLVKRKEETHKTSQSMDGEASKLKGKIIFRDNNAPKNVKNPDLFVVYPCKFCNTEFKTAADNDQHEIKCHKKAATLIKNTGSPAKRAIPGSGLDSPMVLNVPKAKGLNDIIKHAIEAASGSGVPGKDKFIIVKGPNMKDTRIVLKASPQKIPPDKQDSPQKGEGNKEIKNPDSQLNRTSKDNAKVAVVSPKKGEGNKELESPDSQITRASKDNAKVAVVSPEPKKQVVLRPSVKSMLSKGRDSSAQIFTCLDCGSCFSSRQEVIDHKRECTQVGKIKVCACMDCGETFSNRSELLAHRKANHQNNIQHNRKSVSVTVRGYRCSACDIFFPDSQELRTHIVELHGGVAEGTMCNVMASPDPSAPINWNEPISNEMVEDVIQNLVDGVSKSKGMGAPDKQDTSKGVATQPNTAPKTPMKNTIAQTSISQSPTTSEHDKSGDTEIIEVPSLADTQNVSRKPGQCLDCFAKVNSRLELAQHKRVCPAAIQNKNVCCSDCGTSFKSYRDLSAHRLGMHTNADQGILVKCPPCGITFQSYSGLLHHNRVIHGWQANTESGEVSKSVHSKKDQTTPKVQDLSPKTKDQNLNPKSPDKNKTPSTVVSPVGRSKRTQPVKKEDQNKDADVIVIEPEKSKEKAQPASKSTIKASQAIGTIRFLDEKTDEEKKSPQKRQMEESPKEITRAAKIPKTTAKTNEDRTSISLANGLVTISADKANDYQIFVDAKPDGSSIQVKLVRNEELTKKASESTSKGPEQISSTNTSKRSVALIKRGERLRQEKLAAAQVFPKKTGQASKSITDSDKMTTPVKGKSDAVKKIDKEEDKDVVVVSPTTRRSPRSLPVKEEAKKTNVQEKVKNQPKQVRFKEPSETSEKAVESGTTIGKDKDIGMVVQKGKPFVIGGQTMVPIQFPPGFQLPGGNTGGQKVFAIPATNLPPGLLQLMGKQIKTNGSQASTSSTKASTEKTATSIVKSKPSKISQVPPNIKVSTVPASSSTGPPSPLKGMTGAQLMARAQAKILGRPLGNDTQTSSASAILTRTQASQNKDTKSKVSPNAKKKESKKDPPTPELSPRQPNQPGYQDPLFVFQCTDCNETFSSTADVKMHVADGSCGASKNRRKTRSRRTENLPEKTEAGEWLIKPVEKDQNQKEDVEWFVASSK